MPIPQKRPGKSCNLRLARKGCNFRGPKRDRYTDGQASFGNAAMNAVPHRSLDIVRKAKTDLDLAPATPADHGPLFFETMAAHTPHACEDHSGNSHGVTSAMAPTAPPTAAGLRDNHANYACEAGCSASVEQTLTIVEMTTDCRAAD